MLLVNVVENDKISLSQVNAALIELIYGTTNSVHINKKPAYGIFTHVMDQLVRMSNEAKYHFPVTCIRLPHCIDAEHIRELALAKCGIVVVDEADQIDNIEGAADVLRSLESPYLKVVYVATVDD
jgi:hypothetical protein